MVSPLLGLIKERQHGKWIRYINMRMWVYASECRKMDENGRGNRANTMEKIQEEKREF